MRCIDDFEVGNRLKALRESKGNNKTDLAIELDISTAQYGRLENGKARITTEVLNKVCAYYNTSINYVLFGETPLYTSIFFEKINGRTQTDIKRFLKILSCLFPLNNNKKYSEEPFYKIFMDELLEMIPDNASSSIMYVLEYEKNRKKASENQMIRELGLTRFKWNTLIKDHNVHDITIPLTISNQYGYDLDFLINNKINDNMFFDNLFAAKTPGKQKEIMQIFDMVVKSGEEDGNNNK